MELAELLQQREWYRKHFKLHYYEPYGYQRKFHHAQGLKSDGLATDRALIAANKIGKCNSLDTIIDTANGRKKLADIWGKEVEVLTWPGKEPRRVVAWVQKPAEECYRITMADGQWVECPAGHLILTTCGFLPISQIVPFLPRSAVRAPGFLSGVRRGVRHLSGTLRGFWGRCSEDFRLYGGQLLSVEEGVLVFAPLPAGVQGRTLISWRADDLAYKCTDIARRFFRHLSSWCGVLRLSGQPALCVNQDERKADQWWRGYTRSGEPYREASCLLHEDDGVHARQFEFVQPCAPLYIDGNRIIEVEQVGRHNLYDMDVEERHNYIAAGMIHHNTYCAGMEVAMHATGLYPSWWEGHRFPHRTEIMCGSESNELTRDVLQKELFGDPEDREAIGTGSIPKHHIGRITRKAGVPNAYDSVMVKHAKGGWSRVFFRAFEQGPKKHMGFHIHLGWTDEEPPREIKSQYKRATLNTRGILMNTFTPESGMTEVCNEYFHHPKIGMALIQATWDDCPLFDDPKYKAEVLDQLPEHEREMRSKGIPKMGSGLVFVTPDEEVMVDPFEIPRHWPRIKALDFGIDHPFAAVAITFDPDTETAYVYWCHRKTRQTIADHAIAVNSFDPWIPVVWPHDGFKKDAQSGKPLADIYRDEPYHVQMLPFCFSNLPPPGKKEGQGGQGVEVGLLAMDEAMQKGRLKVFSTLGDWFEEKRIYHRKDGLVVKERDDLMSATRYGYMSRRFAITEPVVVRRQSASRGLRNW